MSKLNRIITIGGSAGALQGLLKIIVSLDANDSSAVFIVLHGASENLANILTRHLRGEVPWEIAIAKNGERIAPGRIYVAPPDHHMLIQDKNVRIDKGPRVNRSRPAIDLLFRSAAVAYDSAVIGIVLSGLLSDGVAGIQAIKQCGGMAIAQDPDEALHPDLPENAMHASDVDYIKPAGDISSLVNTLVASPAPESGSVPEKVALENRLDLDSKYDIEVMDQLGERASFSCPECGGPLWELSQEGIPRYRCHGGHSMTIGSVLNGQNTEIEKTLRVALRSFEEKKRVQEKLNSSGRHGKTSEILERRLTETDSHIERLRKLIQTL